MQARRVLSANCAHRGRMLQEVGKPVAALLVQLDLRCQRDGWVVRDGAKEGDGDEAANVCCNKLAKPYPSVLCSLTCG